MKPITYTIPLDPVAWQRAGLNFSKRLFFDKQRHEKTAIGIYLARDHGSEPKFIGPVAIDITCYIKIPKSIKDRNLNGCKWVHKKPDADNFLKLIMDSINDTESIWNDDCQVADARIRKMYDKEPRTIITISPL